MVFRYVVRRCVVETELSFVDSRFCRIECCISASLLIIGLLLRELLNGLLI